MNKRALVTARLSHDTDESTSIERQIEAGTADVIRRGDTVAGTTEDADVKGSVSPFDRPGLGPWLTDPNLIGRWDYLIVQKLDRISRSVIDFANLLVWLHDNGKAIVSLDGEVDTSTATGWLHVQIVITFAEFERRRMSERQLDAKRKDRANGVWGGGKPGYGLTTVIRDSKHYLAIDAGQAQVVRRMADDIITGKSARSIAVSLNTEGIPAYRGGTWDASQILAVLRNQTLRGFMTHDGELVRDREGLPVRHDAVVIDEDLWRKLEPLLVRNSQERTASDEAPLLRGVITHTCGQPIYIQRRERGDRYRHKDQTRVACRCDDGGSFTAVPIDSAVEAALLAYVGSFERCEMKMVGEDHRPEIQRLEESLEAWQGKAIDGEAVDAVMPILRGIQGKLDKLRAMPAPREVPVSTGQTFRGHWDSLSVPERNGWLRELGVTVVVRREGSWDDEDLSRFAGDNVSAYSVGLGGRLLVWFGRLTVLVGMARNAA